MEKVRRVSEGRGSRMVRHGRIKAMFVGLMDEVARRLPNCSRCGSRNWRSTDRMEAKTCGVCGRTSEFDRIYRPVIGKFFEKVVYCPINGKKVFTFAQSRSMARKYGQHVYRCSFHYHLSNNPRQVNDHGDLRREAIAMGLVLLETN